MRPEFPINVVYIWGFLSRQRGRWQTIQSRSMWIGGGGKMEGYQTMKEQIYVDSGGGHMDGWQTIKSISMWIVGAETCPVP